MDLKANADWSKQVMDQPPEVSYNSIDIDSFSAAFRPLQKETFFRAVDGEDEMQEEEEKEKYCKVPVMKIAEHYMKRRRIDDFLQFMMNHLLVNQPDNPVKYLQQLLDKCLLFRSGHLSDPPTVFEEKHLKAIYSSFDMDNLGHMSIKQYHTAMATLGVKDYDENPETLENGEVAKETFIANAKMALVESLLDIIVLPPPYADGETSSIETFIH